MNARTRLEARISFDLFLPHLELIPCRQPRIESPSQRTDVFVTAIHQKARHTGG